ncbi:hypothetical protein [Dokdonella soli]|uniref:hypothetical protein n=1 Tax=Dokdonella soli TaxID=529810 RepID=UPI003619DAA7
MTPEAWMPVVEILTRLLWGVMLVVLLLEIWMRRRGQSGVGWGWVGFALVLGAITSASLCALELRLLSGKPVAPGLGAELDLIGLIASIALGGLGTNLWAYGLTTAGSMRRAR